jgi:Na+/H+-dicarboxylate symporter
MSEARAITNLIGNGVATVVIARWENELDLQTASELLNDRAPAASVVDGRPAVQPAPLGKSR